MTKTIVPSKLLNRRFGGTLLRHALLGSDFAIMVTKGSLVGVLVVQEVRSSELEFVSNKMLLTLLHAGNSTL